MTPLCLVHGGVRAVGARRDDVVDVAGVQPEFEDGDVGVVVHDPVRPLGEGAGLLVVAQEGAVEAQAGNGGARGDHHLGVASGGVVRVAQPIGAGITPSANGRPGSLGLVDQGGQQRHVR